VDPDASSAASSPATARDGQHLDESLRILKKCGAKARAGFVGLVGNCGGPDPPRSPNAGSCPSAYRPDSAHDPLGGYVPQGLDSPRNRTAASAILANTAAARSIRLRATCAACSTAKTWRCDFRLRKQHPHVRLEHGVKDAL